MQFQLHLNFNLIVQVYAQKTSLFIRNIWLYIFFKRDFEYAKWYSKYDLDILFIGFVQIECWGTINETFYLSMSKYRNTREGDLVFGVQIC